MFIQMLVTLEILTHDHKAGKGNKNTAEVKCKWNPVVLGK
jgi:hypothetical protein